MPADFRQTLKHASQADHDRVDDLLSSFDIATKQGFEGFLIIHKACFATMLGTAERGTDTASSLRDMLTRIDADLTALRTQMRAPQPAPLPRLDAMALAYLIEGSRLGSRVLKRIWAGSSDPVVRAADAYFSMEPAPGRWKDICDALSVIPVQSTRAGAIIEDTQRLFGMFQDVAIEIKTAHHPQEAIR